MWKQPFHGGIAEDFISARALLKKYPAAGAKEIADAAKSGDTAAIRVWREFGEDLAELLTQWAEHWRLEKIALGGQIAGAWKLFSDPLKGLPVAPSELPDAALYGAYLKAQNL